MLWIGQAASQFGDRIHQIAVLWWALNSRGHLLDAGWVMVATTLPAVLLSPVAGALADRVDRRGLMLACDIGRALITGVLAAIAVSGGLTLPLLIGASVALSALGALFTPASMALVPDLVPPADLVKAGSLQELTIQMATLLGPPLGGLLVALLGTSAAFGCNGLSFLVSALALAAIGAAGKAPGPTGGSFWADLWDGVRLAREIPLIGYLLAAFGFTNLFLAPLMLFLPRYAELFGRGPGGLGMLEGALALGILLATGLLMWQALGFWERGKRRPREQTKSRPQVVETSPWLYPASLAAIGGLMAALGSVESFLLFLVGLAGVGFALGILNVTVVAYFQQTVPPERIGRFMGLLMTVVFAAQPLGFALTGMVADTAHPAQALRACGIGILTVAGLLGLALTLRSGKATPVA